MNLSKLLLIATNGDIKKGDIAGTCVVCGTETKSGIPLKKMVSDNFTGWNCLFSGNCMCPECAFIFSDQTFRRRSWLASENGFKTFKNDEACSILFSPAAPPFFIHIAKLGQKQTWLRCLHNVANSTNKYWFSHEGYDIPILFEIGDLCMGRGLVGVNAYKNGKRFVGTELNHKRLAVLLERIVTAPTTKVVGF